MRGGTDGVGRGTGAGRPGTWAAKGLVGVVVAENEAIGDDTGTVTTGARTASGGAVMASAVTGGELGVRPVGGESVLVGAAAGVVGMGAAGATEGCIVTRRALGGGGGWLRMTAGGMGSCEATPGGGSTVVGPLSAGIVVAPGGGGVTLRRGAGGGPDDGLGATDTAPDPAGLGGAATGRGTTAGPLPEPLPFDASLSAIRGQSATASKSHYRSLEDSPKIHSYNQSFDRGRRDGAAESAPLGSADIAIFFAILPAN